MELLLMVVVLAALILLLLLLLVVLVVEEVEDAVVLVLLLPDDADVVVVGPLEAVLVMEAAVLLSTALSAGGVEIGMGDEMGGGGGVGSGADAISADTFGVFGVLTGGGCGTGPFGVKLGDGEGIGTLFPDEFSRSPPLVGVEGICRLLLLRCCWPPPLLRQLAPPIPICWLAPAPLKVWLFCMEPELLPKGDGSDGVTVWFMPPPMELAAAAAAAAWPALYLAFMMSLNCCNPLGELSAIDGPFRKAFCAADGGVIPGG